MYHSALARRYVLVVISTKGFKMFKNRILVLGFFLVLSACVTSHNSYQKGGGPIAVNPECIKSKLSNSSKYKLESLKEGNIIVSSGSLKFNVVFSESNLIVSSESNPSSPVLNEQVDAIWVDLANSCKKESAVPVIYK